MNRKDFLRLLGLGAAAATVAPALAGEKKEGRIDQKTLDDIQANPQDYEIRCLGDGRWEERYYQGTDPVQDPDGRSGFASVIWKADENGSANVFIVPDRIERGYFTYSDES